MHKPPHTLQVRVNGRGKKGELGLCCLDQIFLKIGGSDKIADKGNDNADQ